MKSLWIVANYDNPADGVGKYAARVVEAARQENDDWNITVESASTISFGPTQRLLSLRMAGSLLRAAKKNSEQPFDCVIIEYPFLEWSPLIIPAMAWLQFCCRRRATQLILSLHEYLRVGQSRAWSIRYFARHADAVFVSDEATRQALSMVVSKPIFLRTIPSNIPFVAEDSVRPRDPMGFCFFGIVDKSKTIQEMLSGWRQSYQTGMTLHFISASQAPSVGAGVVVHRALSDREVGHLLSQNTFLLLPIKPTVGPHNGTLKAGLLNGLIPVGRCDPSFRDIAPLFIETSGFRPIDFSKAFQAALALSRVEVLQRRRRAMALGMQWSAQRTVGEIRTGLLALCAT